MEPACARVVHLPTGDGDAADHVGNRSGTGQAVTLDVARIRAQYPALADGHAYLDGAAGTQVPGEVIAAIADAYRGGIGNAHGAFPASARSDAIVARARAAVADLVGGVPEGVVFGPNMTTLTYRLATALCGRWGEHDEVVVSRLDHDANVRPWVQAARRAGARVRWAEIDPATGELPTGQYAELVGERTRLVAVTAASNVLGTRPDVRAIADIAHAAGAEVFVDGVHATPHMPVDIAELAADFYVTSAYKWSGPHVGALIADPRRLGELEPDRLLPVGDAVPDKFEYGTHAFADLAGVAAAVDHLARLGEGPEVEAGTSGGADQPGEGRRQRLLRSMAAVQAHEGELFAVLAERLRALPGITWYGHAAHRAPTAYFTVAGHEPRAVTTHLAERRINAWNGHNYAWEVTGALGIRDSGGAVRVGLNHYNDSREVDRLIDAVAELTG